jgi:hypothetical protein
MKEICVFIKRNAELLIRLAHAIVEQFTNNDRR